MAGDEAGKEGGAHRKDLASHAGGGGVEGTLLWGDRKLAEVFSSGRHDWISLAEAQKMKSRVSGHDYVGLHTMEPLMMGQFKSGVRI